LSFKGLVSAKLSSPLHLDQDWEMQKAACGTLPSPVMTAMPVEMRIQIKTYFKASEFALRNFAYVHFQHTQRSAQVAPPPQ
jgi:hypothetical protein